MTQTQTPRRIEPGRMGLLEFVSLADATDTTTPNPTQEIHPAYPILSRHWPGFHSFNSEALDMSEARKWYSNTTQIYWTCNALLSGREISHKTEIKEVRGWRLGAIIHRLRRDYDWKIVTEYRGPDNVAYYRLDASADISALRFPPSAQSLKQRGVA